MNKGFCICLFNNVILFVKQICVTYTITYIYDTIIMIVLHHTITKCVLRHQISTVIIASLDFIVFTLLIINNTVCVTSAIVRIYFRYHSDL